MRLSCHGVLPWVAFAALAITIAGPGGAQSSSAARSARSPTTATHSPRQEEGPPALPEDLPWNADAATAQCRDGFLTFAPPSVRTCADHGGIHRWLRGRERALLRG